MSAPQDNHKSKASAMKLRIRPDRRGGFKAFRFTGYYVSHGATIEKAWHAHRKLMCELM